MLDGRDGPAPALPDDVAWLLFALLVRRSPGVTGLVEDLLDRPVRARLLGGAELRRIAPPGLTRLATTGPVLRRHVLLTDSRPPHLPVAVTWSVVVPHRLPAPVAGALRSGGEPLDRLLADAGLRRRLAERATRRARELPTWDDTAAGFLRALEEVRP